ncbi:hypothetical protein [Rhizobium sp. L1K21]|uniref:hypothetical protein n=1 Tax=Rhizobium sp. L1K21 TaxID=2954933 RepID=UPI00209214C6|nr:hypothetical protein [Rhizobium sp. L1K21]MCO6185264.1 hypothetical protein [Rhizobium sp. L1K21]
MTSENIKTRDTLVASATSVAWIIALNKPVYPAYVWFLAEDYFRVSLLTALSLPLFAALPFIARKSGFAARAGIVAIGMIDTTFISFALGFETGAWMFLLPCFMLAHGLFYEHEKWPARIAAAFGYVAFLMIFYLKDYAIAGEIPVEQTTALFAVNAVGAASLAAFIVLRFPRMKRP